MTKADADVRNRLTPIQSCPVLCVGVTACASGPAFRKQVSDPAKSTVYVGRVRNFLAPVGANVQIDAQPASKITNEGYRVFKLDPGKHTINAIYGFNKAPPIDFVAEAGKD